VLGRYKEENGSVSSMGKFFTGKETSGEDALMCDRIIRRKAIRRYAEDGGGSYLFVNVRLAWLTRFADKPEEMPTVQFAREYGVDFTKLVIEITEDEFFGDSADYIKVIAFYKDIGCRIAIDDYGKDASQIDRLSALAPDIVKIDMDFIHRSEHSHFYREYLRLITAYADKVGVEILYEGIETKPQLDICVASKGRLFQGYLLAMPGPHTQSALAPCGVFADSLARSAEALQEKAERLNEYRNYWDAKVAEFTRAEPFDPFTHDMNEYFSRLCLSLPDRVRRVYICDRGGRQLSYNLDKEGGAIRPADYRGKSWAWRGYYREAVDVFSSGMSYFLTGEYRDVTTKEKMCTYIRLIGEDMVLHIDISV
jgi:EAL domain-containing protein (putative c-di-GMP-specific phosphodiesterase class I)